MSSLEPDPAADRRAWRALIFVAAAMGFLLFVPAGTVAYWQAWAYLTIYFGSSVLITLYLVKKDPALLKRRLRGGPAAEKERTQKIAVLVASIAFIALLVVAALDHRFGWSSVPSYVVAASDILTVLSFYFVFLVLKENTFSSATVEISAGQKVISTGLYAHVRHPMYVGALTLCFAMPLALGSYWGLLAFGVLLAAIVWRLFDEERLLSLKLPGYVEYCARVRWRLIPGVF
jgi:protein-S-isoprenylcysteine O-methyltransferase Ste14